MTVWLGFLSFLSPTYLCRLLRYTGDVLVLFYSKDHTDVFYRWLAGYNESMTFSRFLMQFLPRPFQTFLSFGLITVNSWCLNSWTVMLVIRTLGVGIAQWLDACAMIRWSMVRISFSAKLLREQPALWHSRRRNQEVWSNRDEGSGHYCQNVYLWNIGRIICAK